MSRSSALLLYSTICVRKCKDALGVSMNAQTVFIFTDKRGVGDGPIYDDSICESAGIRVRLGGHVLAARRSHLPLTVVRKVSSP